jgi:hypothetical protein
MSEKKISYLNRSFEDYRAALRNYVREYYPSIADKFEDASIGSFLIDLVASVSDNLSFHIDRVFQETNLESAGERSSVMAIARTNGLKVSGPKASMAGETFSCYLPVAYPEQSNSSSSIGVPNWAFAPVIKRGTKLAGGSQYFEVLEDVDFSSQFNANGESNRLVQPVKDGNGKIIKYLVKKYETVYAGETKIYKQVITSNDVKPFMEIVLPERDIMNIESIIFKDGVNYNNDPSMSEFMNPNEFVPASSSPSGVDTYRFFEVNSLVEQYRWGDDISTTRAGNQNVGKTVTYEYGYYNQEADTVVPTFSITKGQWVPLTQKFITEYTDNGYLKIIFGCGETAGQTVDYTDSKSDFTTYQMTKMIRNDFLGKLPKGGWTMYVQYRVGGGESSNVAKDTINRFVWLNAEIGKCLTTNTDASIIASVRDSLRCTNTTPSVCGKNAPTIDEIRNMIKYNSSAQERCVTLKDYLARIESMPARYGSPFRVGAIEENNKVMLYMLTIDNEGKLSVIIPEQLARNMENYLSMYRSINDFVEMKVGRIINLSFEVDVFVDKNYNTNDVIRNIINTVKDYMDVNKHQLGEDIYIGDLEKEISKVDGVLNLTDLRVYNEYGSGYSSTKATQQTVEGTVNDKNAELDMDASEYILNSDADEMFEIKYPNADIRCRCRVR